MYKKLYIYPILFALALVLGSVGFRSLSAKDSANDERERAMKAGEVLSQVMQIPEDGIPNDLMARADAVAVIPHMVKGAFGIGGEYGKGLVSERRADGTWSAPSYIKIGGGNFGFQLGVEATDLVLVFTDHNGFKGLLDGKVKLGADAQVAAGPVGRHAQVATDIMLKSPVFAYSRSKGLFAGISLDGAVVEIDDSANRGAYGRAVSAQDILLTHSVHKNDVVMPFLRVLDQYAPAHKRATD
ncbi:MAG TPA: lipid-binding SYLF domain-containing protein [Terriglobia bacterium]|jgi:lipid-binding SYLF domain-containing protein